LQVSCRDRRRPPIARRGTTVACLRSAKPEALEPRTCLKRVLL